MYETRLSLFQYFIVLVLIVICDGIWISANLPLYSAATRVVQGSDMETNLPGAAMSYLCLYALLVLYAVPIVLERMPSYMSPSDTWSYKFIIAMEYGGLLGLLTYGVYNFTCLAILKNYPLEVAIRDTLWGGALFTIVTFVVALL